MESLFKSLLSNKLNIILTSCTLLIFFCFHKSTAQVSGEQRGLYVDNFIEINSSTGAILPTQSILGDIFKEKELLQYCMENHITYITLYGLRNIFLPTTNGANYDDKRQKLCDFIDRAKNEYCIKYVGASVAGFVTADNIGNNLLRMSPPIIFDSTMHGTAYYDSLKFVEDTIQIDDERFEVAEAVKLSLRLMNFIMYPKFSTVC